MEHSRGHLEYGEGFEAGAVREVREETGIKAEIISLVDVIDSLPHSEKNKLAGQSNLAGRSITGTHFVLIDFCAKWISGIPKAASDAADAKWMTLAEIDQADICPETKKIIHKSKSYLAPD
jgi:8-oxo-dGTP diphosphatase